MFGSGHRQYRRKQDNGVSRRRRETGCSFGEIKTTEKERPLKSKTERRTYKRHRKEKIEDKQVVKHTHECLSIL